MADQERISIQYCPADVLFNAPNRNELFDEYAIESSVEGLPPHNFQFATYKTMEDMGLIRLICAYSGTTLIGFISILTTVLPHYGIAMSTTESFFVAKAYRKTGAGMKLLREAEWHAKASGSPGLLVSAPIGGVLAQVLPKVGYAETNRIFFRKFTDA